MLTTLDRGKKDDYSVLNERIGDDKDLTTNPSHRMIQINSSLLNTVTI